MATNIVKSSYPVTLQMDISSSRTFNLENHSRIIIDAIGQQNAAKGTIYIYCSGTGTVAVEKVGLSGATLTTGTNTLTVSGINAGTFVRVYRGGIS